MRQDFTLRWFTASTISGKRLDQSLPRRVSSRMPTGSRRAIRRIAVVLDLVNPVRARRRFVGGRIGYANSTRTWRATTF